jgi:hypothetical protein
MRQGFIVSLVATLVLSALPLAADAQNRPARVGGKPNLNGIWQAMNTANWNLEGHAASQLIDFWRLGSIGAIPAGQSVVKEGKIPYLPEALARREENRAGWPKTDPEAACYLPGIPRANYMPYPFQIVQGDDDILFVYSFANANRAVHMKDTRTIDEVPVDLWMGWSNGRWDGDTLVVETAGFREGTWLDNSGHPHTDALRTTERYRRLDYGTMELQVTIDDAKAYSRPWTSQTIRFVLQADTELMEHLCENNRALTRRLERK